MAVAADAAPVPFAAPALTGVTVAVFANEQTGGARAALVEKLEQTGATVAYYQRGRDRGTDWWPAQTLVLLDRSLVRKTATRGSRYGRRTAASPWRTLRAGLGRIAA